MFMSILIFLGVLFVLILVHELGHFLVAKKVGMRVDEFGIGFPPRIAGIKRGETLYSLNLLPVGGFVRIFGEDAASVDANHPDRSRAFALHSRGAQALVLIAGVAMNVLLAWVLFALVLMLGVEQAVSEQNATPETPLVITSVLPESPAQEAGVRAGARVVSVSSAAGQSARLTPGAFSEFIAQHPEEPLTLVVSEEGNVSEIVLTPAYAVIEHSERAALGVSLALIEHVVLPPHEAVVQASTMTISFLRDITFGLGTLLFDAVQLNADLSHIAGPVGIAGLVGEASALGIVPLLLFTAIISLNLAIINLLPFPALDGGRLLFVAIEAVKGTPIPPVVAHSLNTVGFFLLILLMIAVTYHDIMRLW